jgi:arsenate reductase (thioredoxin)
MCPPSVLFLCVHNAGRSQMAAGLLRSLAGEQIEVLSAGSDPADSINPAAVAVMAEKGPTSPIRRRGLGPMGCSGRPT